MFYGYKVTEKMYLRITSNYWKRIQYMFKKTKNFQNASIWTNKKEALKWDKKVKQIWPNAILYSTKY